MDLDFEKYCKVDQSPRTELPSSHHHPKIEKRSKKLKPSSKTSHLSLEKGFNEIKLRNYHRSVSCKTHPTKNTEPAEDSELLKRGSVYQSSQERTSFNTPNSVNRRKKIEFSVGTPFSFSLLDSICGSDEEEEEERDDNGFLQKSLSAKLALPHSPTHSEKSVELDNGEIKSLRRRNKALRKSLLQDFSNAQCVKSKDQEEIVQPSSPAHLHGDLKFEHKHGVPHFELSLPHSENVLVAKTWKSEDALNWVYTFHSVESRKKSKCIGQMQVSCHLCSELKDRNFKESMITEFVLYDIMDAKKSLEDEELDSVPEFVEHLQPSNEIAAVVIQAPFEKRESLKHRSSDAFGSLDLSLVEQSNLVGDATMVNVVTPLGKHSLPTCESRGPSPLLDRWRLGGGCDCGGWEMACPLVVFNNVKTRLEKEEHSVLQKNQPFKLYLQGAKEKTPALTMKFSRKGHYSINFHAQLSALQALAVCVSILHTSEISSVDQEKHKQLLQCSSNRGLIEDQVQILIEAVQEKEKKKKNTVQHSFVLNPPISPISRV